MPSSTPSNLLRAKVKRQAKLRVDDDVDALSEERDRAMDKGAFAFLQRPYSPDVLVEAVNRAAKQANVPVHTASIGSMFTVFFSDKPVRNFDDASACDIPAFRRYFASMLHAGIYLAPSQYEAGFLSIAHSEEDIETTLRAGAAALQSLA